MPDKPLFQTIADAIRLDIYNRKLKPGDPLPPVRDMAVQFDCAPGTVQRAYRQLTDEGLITSRVGQGTCVADIDIESDYRLRQLKLVNRIESFVLDLMAVGHTSSDINRALRLALDGIGERRQKVIKAEHPLRFSGSHDPALSMTCASIASDQPIEMSFVGSMNGLLDLAQGNADFSGCHLYDGKTNSYNIPYIRRLFSGREMAVLTLASRWLGLIVAPQNPLAIESLFDLTRADVRFVNRQPGAGTRLWLDNRLQELQLSVSDIMGYDRTVFTHSEVARIVADDSADVGIGVEAAAQAYGLGFIPLTTEQYDLVIPVEHWQTATMQRLVGSLQEASTRQSIATLGGYNTENTGQLMWVS